VIYLSAAQRIVVSDLIAQKGELATEEAWHGEHALFRLWYVWIIVALCSPHTILAHAGLSGFFPPSSILYIHSGGT
jgi:hypothetical protein